MDLREMISHLGTEYDVLEYLTARKEFLNLIAQVNGVIFDTHDAIALLSSQLLQREQVLTQKRATDGEFTDLKSAILYFANLQHIHANEEKGWNLRLVGNYCLVALYQYWEENTRPRIAKVFRVGTNEIRNPLFGDIRTIRNAIIHNKGIATSDVEKNRFFKWYKRGEEIIIDKQQYLEMSQAIVGAVLDHSIIPDAGSDWAHLLRQHPI